MSEVENELQDTQEVQVDDFISNLANPTDAQEAPPPPPPPPKEDPPSPGKDDADADFLASDELLADLVVELFDYGISISCQMISGEINEELFTVSDYKKKRIKEPLAKIFKTTNLRVSPYFIVIVTALIIYAPMINKALGIRSKKQPKKAAVIEPAPDKRPVGRPRKDEVKNAA